MAGRTNAPICTSKLGPNWIDSGTSALIRSGSPAPNKLDQLPQTITVAYDLPHRLLLAARNGLPYLAPEIRDQLRELLTIENFAFLAAFMAADAFFAGTGVGTVVNVAAGGLMIMFVGTKAISGVHHLAIFYNLAKKATMTEDFQSAGQEFAKGVTALGVGSMAALLSGRSGARSSLVASAASQSEIEASWIALADSIEFNVPTNKGVIFAGLGDAEKVRAIATRGNPEVQIISDTLEKYGFTYDNMKADFGKSYGEHGNAATYRLWERVSLRYQQSLKGVVTAYVDRSKIRPDKGGLDVGRGAGPQVEVSNGRDTPSVIITELEELMGSNKNISGVILKDENTKESWVYTPAMKSRFGQESRLGH